jgi:hypothetical protein
VYLCSSVVKKDDLLPPETCPVCGEAVPRGAKACPDCGADERSGWNEEATRYDDLDLPDEAFRDQGAPGPVLRKTHDRIWLVVAVLVTLAVILAFVLR